MTYISAPQCEIDDHSRLVSQLDVSFRQLLALFCGDAGNVVHLLHYTNHIYNIDQATS